ncbi:putative quinol monooxygenase [Microbacterium murale]|uniref:Quinol monooxygenase YgiN n=1 Tax=Microbacterium murale TaxID=1081040 RepID=A0ABU0PC46_9MICO|nr:putative quinol monooxygenase [Microbacterium murale]MDQ0644908.1 quinol monooxygenase YgiN [Microbacterium murale]
MSAGQVTLYAEFTAVPGSADEIESLIQAYAQVVRTEPGNVAFDVYRRIEAPERFFVFEVYCDRDAFNAHLGAEAASAFNAKLMPRIVEPQSALSFLTQATGS